MSIKIALAGNPNSGKTTMFNELTGSNQFVGNWPGVTVEKKEGKLKSDKTVTIQDLPGIYSLSPYSPEEVITRNYLVGDKPNAIINIVDATNIERNLYLTTQLIEIGLPVMIALNMIDVVRKNGDEINMQKLSKALNCPVVETSALKGEGLSEAAQTAVQLARENTSPKNPPIYTGSVEHAVAHIEESLEKRVPEKFLRWYSVKVFERDKEVLNELQLPAEAWEHIDSHIRDCEAEMEDDAESIITIERYNYVEKIISSCVWKKNGSKNKISDKVDNFVTNRILALPIFGLLMFLIYYISISTIGTMGTDWVNEVLVEDFAMGGLSTWFESIALAPWLSGLIVDGIVAGVGAVLGFLPQMAVLFLLLSILEDIGYMARIAFIMDKIFHRFGLSGKSFIPLLIGSGCSVPGIMASRTIENEKDRRMTVMTTSFIPCGAKIPIIGLIATSLFGGGAWVATSAYFIGIASVIISGIILKKTKFFAGDDAPFVMELPPYHIPLAKGILKTTWERTFSFVKKAGTLILLASVIIWFLQAFGIAGGRMVMVDGDQTSFLEVFGNAIAPVFLPLGFGNWKSAVATITGLVAKENIVATFSILYGLAETAEEIPGLAADLSALGAYSFLIFNLLCAPCFAAMGAIKREMNDWRWTASAIGYLTGFAYVISLVVYQLGLLVTGGSFTVWTAISLAVLGALLFLLFRKNPYKKQLK